MEPVRVLPVIVECPVERRADGDVRVRGPARMRVEDEPLGHEFAALFASSPATIVPEGDFLTAAWRKLCLNSVGALNALTRKPAGVLRDEAIGRLALAIVAESWRRPRRGRDAERFVGRGDPDPLPRRPPDAVNSLLADRLAGRRMEIDARNGAIVRKGEKHGIPTPLNRMAVSLLEAQQPDPITS